MANDLAQAAPAAAEAAAITTQIGGEVIPSDKPGCLAMALREPAGANPGETRGHVVDLLAFLGQVFVHAFIELRLILRVLGAVFKVAVGPTEQATDATADQCSLSRVNAQQRGADTANHGPGHHAGPDIGQNLILEILCRFREICAFNAARIGWIDGQNRL